MAFSEATIDLECEYTLSTTGVGTCTLTNNVGAFLFSNLTYELNNHIIETVREPGVLSAIRNYTMLTPNESKALSLAGWSPFSPIVEKNRRFFLSMPLAMLFSVFADNHTPIIGKHVFRFTRAANDNNCYQAKLPEGALDTAVPKTMTIKIIGLSMKVMHIHPHDGLKLKIMSQVEKLTPFSIAFRKWDLLEHPNLAQSKQDLWPVKTVSGTERPRYIIVALQTNVRNNTAADATYFHNNKMRSLRVYLNSEAFPFESWQLDFDAERYGEAYQAYLNFQRSFRNKLFSEPLLDFMAFKDHALFVFDCSRYADFIKPTPVDVKVEFEGTENFPLGTRAYCVIVHDCVFTYTPLTGDVKYLIE